MQASVQDSLSSIRGSSLSLTGLHDRGDCEQCEGCRIENRGVGAVECTEETLRALWNCLDCLRPRSCRSGKEFNSQFKLSASVVPAEQVRQTSFGGSD